MVDAGLGGPGVLKTGEKFQGAHSFQQLLPSWFLVDVDVDMSGLGDYGDHFNPIHSHCGLRHLSWWGKQQMVTMGNKWMK